ncbi:MAG: VWA domain-containing protein [Planctomycetaceae bacterium]
MDAAPAQATAVPGTAVDPGRQRQNTRRLRLRHLWLLLLRMAVIGLMVLALTRPTLPPANYALTRTEAGTGLVIVAAAAAAYFGILHSWRRRTWPRHVWLTRRTVLRGSIGALTAIVLLLGVAWPYQQRVAAEIVSPPSTRDADLPVTAVYLVDTSAGMQYQRQNRTRLESAQELARAHLGRLPSGSRLAVAESSTAAPLVFSADLSAAQNRLDSLKTQAVTRPLQDRLRGAMTALDNDRKRILADQGNVAAELQQDRYLREIYLFTDLAKSAWQFEGGAQLRDEIAARPWLGVYLVDVGVEDPVNVSLTNLKLSREAVPEGGEVSVEATLRTNGDVPREQTVELGLRDTSGSIVKAGQQSIQVPPSGESSLRFAFPAGTGPYRQGELKLVGADPLRFDDQLYFSIRLLPPRKVLIVSDTKSESNLWRQALESLVQGKRAAVETTVVLTDQLAKTELEDFDIVCLINAGRPEPEAWTRLRSFVEGGGGVFIALGAESAVASKAKSVIDPVAYNDPAALALTPGELKAVLSFNPASMIDFRDKAHPLVQRFDEFQAIPDLSATQIRRYWNVSPDVEANTIAPYDIESRPPALLERAVGRGRVLMLTTAVNSTAWNDLIGVDAWTYLVLVDQSLQYLTASAAGRFNATIGAPFSLRIEPVSEPRSCILRMPDFKQLPQEIPKLADVVSFRDLSAAGHYELVATDEAHPLAAGFSLNMTAGESDLTKLTKTELDSLLGEQRYAVSRELESLVRTVTSGRLGQEVYGLVLAALVGVFVLEQIVGAWFYRTDERPSSPTVLPAPRQKTAPSRQTASQRT